MDRFGCVDGRREVSVSCDNGRCPHRGCYIVVSFLATPKNEVIVMLLTMLFIVGLLLLVFALPMWLVTRRGKSFTGPLPRDIDYDNPYPGATLWTNKDPKS
ncbi:MAG: hypothetical protein QOF95_93 [Pseudonocardiales bacterium]|nr:hypothetical protein [Pseudonocardiales bacterium]